MVLTTTAKTKPKKIPINMYFFFTFAIHGVTKSPTGLSN